MPKRIICRRHAANAGDMLTDIGKSQALALALEYMRAGVKFDLIYASPTERATATARLMAGLESAHGIIRLRALIPSDQDTRGVAIGHAIGTRPLVWNTQLWLLSDEIRELLEELATDASCAIVEEIRQTDAGIILVIGHRLFLEALGLLMVPEQYKDIFLMMVLGNCDGFELELDEDLNVVGLKLLSAPVVTARKTSRRP